MRNPERWHNCRITSVQLNGQQILHLENEVLRVSVNLDKGAEIFEFRHKPSDVDAMWHRDCAAPLNLGLHQTAASEVDAFFDQFTGGWQESFPVGNAAGLLDRAQMYLHGEVSLLPWRYEILEDTAERVVIEAAVECVRTPFRIARHMRIESGVPALMLESTIRNTGAQRLPFAWGQHIAFGPPLLRAGARLDLPQGPVRTLPDSGRPRRFGGDQHSDTVRLRDVHGVEADLTYAPPPESATVDNFEIKLRDPGVAAIRNPALGLGIGLTWDAGVLPYLWEWEMCHAPTGYPFWGRDYLIALEPFNCPIGGLTDAGIRERLPQLAPGETLRLEMAAGWCDGELPFRGEWLRRVK